jgi:hypothetical protein
LDARQAAWQDRLKKEVRYMSRVRYAMALVLTLTVVLTSLPAASPASAEGAEMQDLLDCWASSLGGREELAAVKTAYVKSKVKIFGLDGTVEEWSTMDGLYHQTVDVGGMFHVETAFDGESAWLLDQNGKVSEMSGDELRAEITSAYLASWSQFFEGRMPGVARYIGVEDSTGLRIVRLQPAGGDSITFYLDAESCLPVRSEQPSHERVLTVVYSDWRSFDGILIPARFSQSTGDPQYDTSGDAVEVHFDEPPPEGIFARPEESAQDFQFAVGTSALGIPIELNTVHIFLQARVNGSDPLWFVLDTGAQSSAVNKDTAGDLGLEMAGKIEGRGAGEGSVEVNLVPDVTFDLPGVKVTGQTVAAVPLARIEELMGRPIDGILGYDFISRFVVEIDYENLKLNLYDKASYRHSGDGAVVPMELEGGTPRIEATIVPQGRDPIQSRVLVDTGANVAVGFARPFTERNDILSTLTKKFLYEGGAGIGGASKSYIGRIPEVDVGGLKFTSPVCGFSMDKGGAGADPNNAGFLGGEILSRCTVVFDYEHGEMILEPNSNFGKPFRADMSGISWTTGGRGDFHTFKVRRLLPDSPGAEAGLEVGDRLVSLDGVPADDLTINALWKFFRSESRDVELTVERDGQSLTKALHLKPLI